MKLRIGTRGSDLALWQARYVAERLAPRVTTEIVVLRTRGDVIDQVPLQSVEGKAFFTAEIEQALRAREVDLAVHSHKDLPTESAADLVIAAVPARGAAHERMLVRPDAHDPAQAFLPLVRGALVGTSSPRREEQLRTLRPDLAVAPLRGNVPTRVRKLRDGAYGAIVLAAAGLDRLELDVSGLVEVELPVEWFVPAPAQGALAVQVRADDRDLIELLRDVLHDPATARAVAAERALLERAGGGCNLPLGATIEGAGPFRASVFLGAVPALRTGGPRWSLAEGATPESAAQRAFDRLVAAEATHAGPLAGLALALCGSSAGPSDIGTRMAELGARVVHEPALAFEDVPHAQLAARLASLAAGDAIAVTSRQTALRLAGTSAPPGVRVGAVGRASARALADAGWRADVVGAAGARALAAALPVRSGARVLFPCAEDALPDLEEELAARGVHVERLPLYRARPAAKLALARDVDARAFLSPSAVRAACALDPDGARAARNYALGAATLDALRAAGLRAEGAFPASDDGAEELVRLLARRTSIQEHAR